MPAIYMYLLISDGNAFTPVVFPAKSIKNFVYADKSLLKCKRLHSFLNLFQKNSYAVLSMHLQLMHHPIARALTNGVQQPSFLGLSLHTGYT